MDLTPNVKLICVSQKVIELSTSHKAINPLIPFHRVFESLNIAFSKPNLLLVIFFSFSIYRWISTDHRIIMFLDWLLIKTKFVPYCSYPSMQFSI
jgi:hypothetical protein